jgi:hypothetical protein
MAADQRNSGRHGRARQRQSGLTDWRHSIAQNSGKPEFWCHPRLNRGADVDARVKPGVKPGHDGGENDKENSNRGEQGSQGLDCWY